MIILNIQVYLEHHSELNSTVLPSWLLNHKLLLYHPISCSPTTTLVLHSIPPRHSLKRSHLLSHPTSLQR